MRNSLGSYTTQQKPFVLLSRRRNSCSCGVRRPDISSTTPFVVRHSGAELGLLVQHTVNGIHRYNTGQIHERVYKRVEDKRVHISSTIHLYFELLHRIFFTWKLIEILSTASSFVYLQRVTELRGETVLEKYSYTIHLIVLVVSLKIFLVP